MFLLKLVQCFEKARIQYAVCGGQALALHGAVRGTIDVDVVVSLDTPQLMAAEKALTKNLGLESRIPVDAQELLQFREEYIARRNLVAWSFVNPNRASEVVDIIITHNLVHLEVVYKTLLGQKIPVLSIPSLISMKKESARPQDLADVEALEKIYRGDIA